MSMPGFTAEGALSPTTGKYQGNAVFASSGAVEVLPMQEFRAALVPTQSLLWPRPWEKLVTCCGWFNGHIYCTYTWAPVWFNCQCRYGSAICHPPVVATT